MTLFLDMQLVSLLKLLSVVLRNTGSVLLENVDQSFVKAGIQNAFVNS